MPPDKRKPPGCGLQRFSGQAVSISIQSHRDTPQNHKKQARPRRVGFARDMVFQEFGYRAARALDYGDFTDRLPSQSPAPLWWRAGQ